MAREGDLDTPRDPRIGENAVRFTRWFFKDQFVMMHAFLHELEMPPQQRDPDLDRRRLLAALARGRRVLAARVVVTVLLAMGVIATAAATIARAVATPDAVDVDAFVDVLDRVAAATASATILLLALRLAFDRYVARVETAAVFIAMQLASASRAPA